MAPTAVCSDGTRVSNAVCCDFVSLGQDLQSMVLQGDCGEDAHEIIRLTFHDAVAISRKLGPSAGGGADGSMLLFPLVEPEFAASNGIDDSVNNLIPFLSLHPTISAGDLVQFAGAVALSNCPGAPRVQFLAGRPNHTIAAIDGLIPEPQDNVTSILERFDDAGGFTPFEVVSLLASHTIARADKVDPTLDAAPFDTTPFTFDSQIFLEVLLKGVGFPGLDNNTGEVSSPLPLGDTSTGGKDTGLMRLQSDFALAHDPRTACFWQGFVDQQEFMSQSFASAFAKLAVLGHNTDDLIDCSEVVPVPKPAVDKPTTFPATTGPQDLELSCLAERFPTLSVDPGAQETLIPHCSDGLENCTSVQFSGPATDSP
uniref:EXTRALONG MANGANESE PEROXIDASE n=1 Tax=Ceriporiopsis subvermispora TaxID=42742 RepID=UPI00053CEE39|nr:Chain A, EXTRALONG MANGANESE PEROXIDASE [Gelatoporia subvermispora]4CZO_A Chain A, EXTRALONG MANGANESE PEROXIDASE [Gelatoporia subvermispora]4CZP_A Chain A, EXTRALONG MANGANESE PEROXIDASE [Gelatoporia subvermispora]4CZQ_A Chain A, EXTRALONG MANGANESE PEROXIDASE [Gelatoporia subvermispora]4CZR_A Chain A, EXTRALONG MANGANESE PEROXIDASE [Gelatoporia subvermispora]